MKLVFDSKRHLRLWELLKGGSHNKSKIIHGYKRFMIFVGASLVEA